MTQSLRSHFAAHNRNLAAVAADRVHANLYSKAASQVPKDFVYFLSERWMQDVFCAVCRCHALIPFRDYGMRRDKVMTIAPPALIADEVEPKLFGALREMSELIQGLTDRYIAEHLYIDRNPASKQRGS